MRARLCHEGARDGRQRHYHGSQAHSSAQGLDGGIFGDADGIVVIPSEEFEDRLKMGEAATKREGVLFAKIAEGNLRNEPLFDEEKVEKMLKERLPDS